MSTKQPLKVIFLSRAYPPVVGGIEKQNFEIAKALGEFCDVTLIVNTRGKVFLPVFFVISFFQVIRQLHRHDVILLGDGVMAMVGFLIKKISKKPVVSILHGLDITFANSVYKYFWLGYFLPALDKYIAVGNETIKQGVIRGLSRGKFVFIPNGVTVERFQEKPVEKEYRYEELKKMTGETIRPNVILTLGRLVKRKGVAWFIDNVMPKLPNDITYIVAGAGSDLDNIQQAISRQNLQSRVICLGKVTDEEKNTLLETADLFIQPNIRVSGDMEGFGLVVLEAAAHSLMVVASDLEGLQDAIHHGENGVLVEAENAQAYVASITALLQDKDALAARGFKARAYVEKHFSWHSIARLYCDELCFSEVP